MELAQASTFTKKLRYFPKEQDEFICTRIESGMSNSQIKKEFRNTYKMTLDSNNIKTRRKRLGIPLPNDFIAKETAKEAMAVNVVNIRHEADEPNKHYIGPQLNSEEDAFIVDLLEKGCTIPFIADRFTHKFGRQISRPTIRLRKDRLKAAISKPLKKGKVIGSGKPANKDKTNNVMVAMPVNKLLPVARVRGLPPELFIDHANDMQKCMRALRTDAVAFMRQFSLDTITIKDDGKDGKCEVLRVEKIIIE
jgi:hypothetical protein